MDICLLWVLSVVQVEVSATDWTPVQRSSTECGVSECNLETSTMRKSRLIRAVEQWRRIEGEEICLHSFSLFSKNIQTGPATPPTTSSVGNGVLSLE
jgi:hypothetical protein